MRNPMGGSRYELTGVSAIPEAQVGKKAGSKSQPKGYTMVEKDIPYGGRDSLYKVIVEDFLSRGVPSVMVKFPPSTNVKSAVSGLKGVGKRPEYKGRFKVHIRGAEVYLTLE